jgi:predicted metal-dependent phosphoesterase TrpH
VRIDLHTHSDRSDGTVTPEELVALAARAGLDVVGLTDHDTDAGWKEAAAAAEQHGVGLVRGMEISCRHEGRSAHLLAYLPDPAHPPLAAALEDILRGRDERMPRIVARLSELGHDITEQDVIDSSGGATALGRPHVADVLVARGVVGSRDEAFDRLLSPGRPAYVSRSAADLVEMLGIVAGAGGVSVLAHPWGRHGNAGLDRAGFADLRDAGLLGIEVDHQDHAPGPRAELRRIAVDLGLVVTGSSDYHGTGKVDHELGCNTTDPTQLDRLLTAAAQAADSAGRRTPGLAGRW